MQSALELQARQQAILVDSLQVGSGRGMACAQCTSLVGAYHIALFFSVWRPGRIIPQAELQAMLSRAEAAEKVSSATCG